MGVLVDEVTEGRRVPILQGQRVWILREVLAGLRHKIGVLWSHFFMITLKILRLEMHEGRQKWLM